MPRIKSSPKKCIKSNLQQSTNSWVFLIKGEAFELSDQYTGSGTPDIVNLRHPKTNESAIFLFSTVNNSVQEILTYNDRKRSWFIDNKIKSDGKMLLSTPIDPLFLILPYLKNSTQTMPIEQLLKDDDYPETERLLKTIDLLKYLNVIADRKGDDELNAFKYNEDKTMVWLKKKTERVAEILKQKNIHVGGGAVSATFKSNTTTAATESDYLRYAHGIVSEYLMDDLCQKLFKYLNLPEDTTNKRKSSTSNPMQDSKRPRLDDNDDENNTTTTTEKNNVLDLSKPEPKASKSQTAKEKARSKAAAGSKSISAFFKKT